MEMENDTKRSGTTANPKGQAAMLKKIVKDTYRIVGIGIGFLLIFIVLNVLLNSVSSKQPENTMYLN